MSQISIRTRSRFSKEEAATFIREYRESGMTQSEFCRTRKVPLWRLHRWLAQERRGELTTCAASRSPELIRLALPEPNSEWAFELDWQRRQLRFGRQFDPEQLKQLLILLGVC